MHRGVQVREGERARIRRRQQAQRAQAQHAREREGSLEAALVGDVDELEGGIGDILGGLASMIPVVGPLIGGLVSGLDGGGDKSGGADSSKGAAGAAGGMDPNLLAMLASGGGAKSSGSDLGPLTALLAAQNSQKTDPMTSLLAAQALNAKSSDGGKITSDPEVRALLEQLVSKVDAQSIAQAQKTELDEARKVAGDAGTATTDAVKAALDPYLSSIKGDLDFQQKQTQATYEAQAIMRRRAFESAVVGKLDQILQQNAQMASWPRRY